MGWVMAALNGMKNAELGADIGSIGGIIVMPAFKKRFSTELQQWM